MKKPTKSDQEKINYLCSTLSQFRDEFSAGQIVEESLYGYFRQFMKAAGVNSDITIAVLEEFGEAGHEEALIIKIEEGY